MHYIIVVNPCLDTNVNLFHTRYERTAYLPSLSYKWDWACVPSSTDHSSSNPFLVDIVVDMSVVSSSLIEPPSFHRWYEPQSLPRQYKRPSLSYSVLPFLIDMSVRTLLDGWIHTSIHSSLILLILSIWAFVYVWASFDTYIQPFHMSVPSFLLLYWQTRCTSLLSHNTNRVAAHYCCRV